MAASKPFEIATADFVFTPFQVLDLPNDFFRVGSAMSENGEFSDEETNLIDFGGCNGSCAAFKFKREMYACVPATWLTSLFGMVREVSTFTPSFATR